MNLSKRFLDQVLVVLALATTIVTVLSLADSSGNPAPMWREISMIAGPVLCLLVSLLNLRSGRFK